MTKLTHRIRFRRGDGGFTSAVPTLERGGNRPGRREFRELVDLGLRLRGFVARTLTVELAGVLPGFAKFP
jgi:hypothetical protein